MYYLGCIRYKGAKIQLLDLPGIIEGAKDGKGRGRQVIAVARTASLIFIGTIKKALLMFWFKLKVLIHLIQMNRFVFAI